MKKLFYLFLSLVLLAGLTSCVSKTDYDTLELEKLALEEELAAVKEELNQLKEAFIGKNGDIGGENDMKNPQVTIEMENGDKIVIELYPDIAPNTVNNFISIVKNGYLDGTIFHRVSPTFMIQGGDMGYGKLGYTIKGEFTENGFENNLKHEKGVISMARSTDPDSATSQFFLMTAQSTYLDGKYAGFGKVIEGIENVDKIASSEWSQSYGDGTGKPKADQKMAKVTVETFGVEYPEPEKIK